MAQSQCKQKQGDNKRDGGESGNPDKLNKQDGQRFSGRSSDVGEKTNITKQVKNPVDAMVS